MPKFSEEPTPLRRKGQEVLTRAYNDIEALRSGDPQLLDDRRRVQSFIVECADAGDEWMLTWAREFMRRLDSAIGETPARA